MARATHDDRTRIAPSRRGAAGRLPGRVKGLGAEIVGYAWASFLVAASGTETLLARILTKRR